MKNVLIVDDAVFMRGALKALLSSNDFNVVGEAADGEEAIKKYKELKPDLVTMDITMKGMDGIEGLKGILEFDPQAKVVMISALGQEAAVKKAIICGAKSFIVKPYKNEHVIKTLNKIAGV
ncbi:response regulator [Clostridium sp. YIM B02505]|uniref:Stage 0 sporulation protein A homolog n=1 Tax=Clostridium yunnanense TaxID=2800325 RepID=A0ABS1EMA1_9CLOT|nr:response regulator [Clostridium yunnanense]MBK1810476.1 response regulator [Clostridium yunnanense]